jgi:putative membrane protein
MSEDPIHTDRDNAPKGDPRDLLALQRTRLAVERTFLSFVRTGIAILAGAVGIPYLFEGGTPKVAGWILGGVAALVVVWGFIRYRMAKRRLELQGRKLAHERMQSYSEV